MHARVRSALKRAGLVAMTGAVGFALVAPSTPASAASVAVRPASAPVATVLPAKAGKVAKISKVSVRAAGYGKVKVTWKRSAKADKIWVVGSYYSDGLYSNKTPASKRWKSKTLKGNANSVILTVPAKFRTIIGGSAANAVYVKVFAKTRKTTTVSPSAKCGWPGGPAPAGSYAQRVTFASYNIAGVQATQSIPGRSWGSRRGAVRNAIVASKADVVAVQEANLSTWNGVRQVDDLANLLRPYGYVLAYDAGSIGGTAGTDKTKESHLFYKPSRVTVLSSGLQSVRALNPGVYLAQDRYFSWAVMRSNSSGATFTAASLHLKVGSDATTARGRAQSILGIQSFMRNKGGGRNIVMMGDYNSDVRRWPHGPESQLVYRGWVNAAASKARYNYKYASVNHQGNGYPAKPVVSSVGQVGTRIDNIFMYRTSGSWAYTNQVILGAGGRFNENYRGSDHNLQKAVISIR